MNMGIKIEKKEKEEAWIVKPIPGFVYKWKDVKITGALGDENRKCFVNVCHCKEIPPPIKDLSEEELAEKLDVGDTSYRIPICIGELECVKDRKDENSIKVDVLLNSGFYSSRLQSPDSTFFRHFLALVFCDMIKSKHCIELDPMKSIILKNRSVVGDLEAFQLRKTPQECIVEDVTEIKSDSCSTKDIPSSSLEENENCSSSANEIVKNIHGILNIKGVRIRCFEGKRLEISVKCDDINDPKRLQLKLNPSRVMILADKSRSLFDFSVPFIMDPKTAKSKFIPEKNSLIVSTNVIFIR